MTKLLPIPFDPALAGDDGVLSITWSLSDHRLDTEDTTRLCVELRNRSRYFQAEQLDIRIAIAAPPDANLEDLPDGNALIALSPPSQPVRRIRPGHKQRLDYFLTTRGAQAGLYALSVSVDYQLVYVYREVCRHTTAIAHLPLRIHGGSTPPLEGRVPPLPPSSEPHVERISIPQRRLHMSEQVEQDGEYGHSKRRELRAIERKVTLPGGGEVIVSYRLVKGARDKPDSARCSFGYNEKTKELESYFSSSDEADMEITLRNCSGLQLRHIYLSDVHLFTEGAGGAVGDPADQGKLPDGNFLFQVLPNDVYFGALHPNEERTRYLGLVTRGIRPGKFLVRFEVKYEIVDGNSCVDLPLLVNPD